MDGERENLKGRGRLKKECGRPGQENPHLKVVHMIGSTGCFSMKNPQPRLLKSFTFPQTRFLILEFSYEIDIFLIIKPHFVKLHIKTGTFKNILHIPGSKFQGVFSMEASTPKISPAAHLYHLHVGGEGERKGEEADEYPLFAPTQQKHDILFVQNWIP